MKAIFHPIFFKHRLPGHRENPDRLSALKLGSYLEAEDGEKYLSLAHDAAYIEKIKNMSQATLPGQAQRLDVDTYVTAETYKTVCYAAGAAVQAAKIGGFAVTRPPGHHAPYGGFCLFNNMVIAAKASKKRTFIID